VILLALATMLSRGRSAADADRKRLAARGHYQEADQRASTARRERQQARSEKRVAEQQMQEAQQRSERAEGELSAADRQREHAQRLDPDADVDAEGRRGRGDPPIRDAGNGRGSTSRPGAIAPPDD
jgi:hypothetical protein